ncbi:8-oxoguanine deaminase [Myxococcota bacterium]|nr:8-oxoguanine deaminase [Myxococcota bacterium]
MVRLLISNALRVVTLDAARREIEGGYVVIEDRVISEVSAQRPAGPFDRVIDATGCVVIPGMINTHHHLYQTLTRVVPFVQDAKLFDWLLGLYEIWREVSAEAVYHSATVGIGELLLSGCTTVADHFYLFPDSQPGALLDETIRAAAHIGVRFHPTRGSMSRGRSQGGLPPDDVVQPEAVILEDSARVIAEHHDPAPLSMCRVALAPCSPFSVTDRLLEQSAELARAQGVRLHTHLAETLDEDDFCLQTHGVRPLEYMARVGWLGADVWYAHGVHFNDEELDRLAETQTGVAHCPISNLRLGSGIARVPEMLKRGVPVGLAVDGSASNDGSNMLVEARVATLVHRVGSGVDQMPARAALELATLGSARVLGRDDVGALAPGMAADLAIFDLNDVAYAGALHDPVAALLMTAGPARARFVVVNGRVVVDEGRLTTVDLAAASAEVNQMGAAMVKRMYTRTRVDPYARR